MKEDWQIRKIGEVCDLMTGGTPPRSKAEYFGGEVKWLVSGDIHQGEIFDCKGRITEAGMQASNAKQLPSTR
jgi:type I restriction enzyme S subunit